MLTRTNENKQGMEEVYGGLHVQRNRQSLKHANNQKCLISIVLCRSWDKSRFQKITTHGSKTLTAQYCLVLIFHDFFPAFPSLLDVVFVDSCFIVVFGVFMECLAVTCDAKSVFKGSGHFKFLLRSQISTSMNSCALSDIVRQNKQAV